MPLAPGSSLDGIPVHLKLFRSPRMAAGPASALRSTTYPKLAAILRSSSMQACIKLMQHFVNSYSTSPNLSSQLHEPVLGGAGTDEQLPIKLLRDVPGSIHL